MLWKKKSISWLTGITCLRRITKLGGANLKEKSVYFCAKRALFWDKLIPLPENAIDDYTFEDIMKYFNSNKRGKNIDIWGGEKIFIIIDVRSQYAEK